MTLLDLCGNLRDLNIVSIILRFVLAALLSGVIGLERGRKQHAAGLRTHPLVCIGAASVMMTSQYMSMYFQTGDPARLGAQVISGIGFLGAGTIIVTGRNQVRGLTTAAGLWASACMGLAVGSGFYEAAVLMCALLYLVLVTVNQLDNRYVKNGSLLQVYLEYESGMRFSAILRELRNIGCHVVEMTQVGQQEGTVTSFQITLQVKKGKGEGDRLALITRIQEIPGVLFAEDL